VFALAKRDGELGGKADLGKLMQTYGVHVGAAQDRVNTLRKAAEIMAVEAEKVDPAGKKGKDVRFSLAWAVEAVEQLEAEAAGEDEVQVVSMSAGGGRASSSSTTGVLGGGGAQGSGGAAGGAGTVTAGVLAGERLLGAEQAQMLAAAIKVALEAQGRGGRAAEPPQFAKSKVNFADVDQKLGGTARQVRLSWKGEALARGNERLSQLEAGAQRAGISAVHLATELQRLGHMCDGDKLEQLEFTRAFTGSDSGKRAALADAVDSVLDRADVVTGLGDTALAQALVLKFSVLLGLVQTADGQIISDYRASPLAHMTDERDIARAVDDVERGLSTFLTAKATALGVTVPHESTHDRGDRGLMLSVALLRRLKRAWNKAVEGQHSAMAKGRAVAALAFVAAVAGVMPTSRRGLEYIERWAGPFGQVPLSVDFLCVCQVGPIEAPRLRRWWSKYSDVEMQLGAARLAYDDRLAAGGCSGACGAGPAGTTGVSTMGSSDDGSPSGAGATGGASGRQPSDGAGAPAADASTEHTPRATTSAQLAGAAKPFADVLTPRN
jgi:hypothetical protein